MRRILRAGGLIPAALALVLLGAGLARVGAESSPARVDGAFQSGGGNLAGGDLGLASGAGQVALGDAASAQFGLGTGTQTVLDACPTVDGGRDLQGCDQAVQARMALHVIDQAKSGECERLTGTAGGSCMVPLDAVKVKVFDRNRLNGLEIDKRDGSGAITLSKNPHPSLYDDVFESPTAHAEARAALLGCVTRDAGSCYAGLEGLDDLLVITRWTPPGSTAPVWVGRPAGDDADEADDDEATAATASTVLTKDLQVLKTIHKDGTVTYSGAQQTTRRGSWLRIVRPQVATWTSSVHRYPITLNSDTRWDTTLCFAAGSGFTVTAVLDDEGGVLSTFKKLTSTCVTRTVDGRPQGLMFEVAALTGGAPDVSLAITTIHQGTTKHFTRVIPGVVELTTEVGL